MPELHSIYTSNSQVKVVDRTVVVTANAETVAVKPLGIQEAINAETGNCIQHILPFLNLHTLRLLAYSEFLCFSGIQN